MQNKKHTEEGFLLQKGAIFIVRRPRALVQWVKLWNHKNLMLNFFEEHRSAFAQKYKSLLQRVGICFFKLFTKEC